MSSKRTEKEILKDLEKLCTSPGYAYALAFLVNQTYYSNSSNITNLDKTLKRNSETALPTEIDLLLGMMLKAEKNIAFSPISHDIMNDYLTRTTVILAELKQYLGKFVFEVMPNFINFEKTENLVVSAEAVKEVCLYGGDTVYDFQYKKFAPERYKNDDIWMGANKNFKISDMAIILETIDKMLKENMKKIGSLIIQMSSDAKKKDCSTDEFIQAFYNDETKMNCLINEFLQAFFIEIKTIIEETKLPKDVVGNVINAFSLAMPCNKGFQEVGDKNKITRKPIIKFNDEKIVLFQYQSLIRSFYESPFFWMTKGEKKNKKADSNRGKFTENAIFELLKKVFPREHEVYKNVFIYNKDNKDNHDGEIDVLVIYGDVAIVVQAKSKKMRNISQKGIYKPMESDFKEAIQHAYEQGYNSAICLLKKESILKNKKKQMLDIKREFKEVFILCITADQYKALEFQKEFLLNINEHEIISYPYIADVFILDVLCEFVSKPIKFLDFIRKRTFYFKKIRFVNELSVLGHYFKYDLYLPKNSDSIIPVIPPSSFYINEPFMSRRINYPGKKKISGKDFKGKRRTFP